MQDPIGYFSLLFCFCQNPMLANFFLCSHEKKLNVLTTYDQVSLKFKNHVFA